MSVAESLNEWLDRQGTPIPTDKFKSLCQRIAPDDLPSCWALLYEYEIGRMTDDDFTGGLLQLSDKEPAEIGRILGEIANEEVAEAAGGSVSRDEMEEIRQEAQPEADDQV